MAEQGEYTQRTSLRRRAATVTAAATVAALTLAGCASPEQSAPPASGAAEAGAPVAPGQESQPATPEDPETAAKHQLQTVAQRIIQLAARGNGSRQKVTYKSNDSDTAAKTPRDSLTVTIGPIADGGRQYRYEAQVGAALKTAQPYSAGTKVLDASVGRMSADQPASDKSYHDGWAGFDNDDGVQFVLWDGKTIIPKLYASGPTAVGNTQQLTPEAVTALETEANTLMDTMEAAH